MRFTLAALSLLITLGSLGVDLAGSHPPFTLCRLGMCRSDQLFASIDAQGITPASLSPLLEQDASNPLVWSAYAEALDRQGRHREASDAFQHAVALGPHMPPVLMRATNFAFTHGEQQRAWELSRRILEQTDAFDEVVFSYLPAGDDFDAGLLGAAVPADSRASRAWLHWLRAHGSDRTVLQTSDWMKQHGLWDAQSAMEAVLTLWDHHAFQAAQHLWIESMGVQSEDYTCPQQLANRRFQNEPRQVPFDWTIEIPASVTVARNDGLEVSFDGTENVAFNHVRQTAVLPPGRYRFSAEIQGAQLTTDRGPFFHIFDALNPERLQASTPAAIGTVKRSWTTVDFVVPPSTQAVVVQLERRASDRIDRKISGTLHVYQVSLVRI